jgi:hypothetical protein
LIIALGESPPPKFLYEFIFRLVEFDKSDYIHKSQWPFKVTNLPFIGAWKDSKRPGRRGIFLLLVSLGIVGLNHRKSKANFLRLKYQ